MSNFAMKKKKRYRKIEDVDSGEQLYAIFPVKKNNLIPGFFTMFQNASEMLATDEVLTGNDYKVLFMLFTFLDTRNYISVCHSIICEKLKMKKSNVSRSISTLVSREIIIRGPRVNGVNTYLLNAKYGYMGKLNNYDKTRKMHLELIEDYKTDKEIEKRHKKLKEVKKEINEDEKQKDISTDTKQESDAEYLIKKQNHPTLFDDDLH